MRLVFMGTPEFAVPSLTEIVGQGHDVAAVYTRAPAAAGRGMALRPSPVHALAERFGLPVRTPGTLRDPAEAEALRALEAEVTVVVAYGLLLPQPVLDAPRLGSLNLHGSLLPRWRGAAPIQRALMAGDAETGVMVMRMEAGLDTGPVAMAERLPIPPEMTAGALHDRLALLGADLMVRALGALARGSLRFTPQATEGVVYARKIEKAECQIDWTVSAVQVHDHIRGLSPAPGAFFEADVGRGPERIKVLASCLDRDGNGPAGAVLAAGGERLVIGCGVGAVALTRVQRAGKPPVDVGDFLRGTPLQPGLRLSMPGG